VDASRELPLHQSTVVQKHLEEEKSEKEINRINRRRMLLPKVIGFFKMQTAKQINLLRNTPGQPVWHRNYYEHIILTDKEFEAISDYIEFNPANWGSKDEYYR
jgi:putative transposase